MRRQDIAVGGILIHDGKVLMIRRSQDELSSAGYWEFPKGKVEWGENPSEALKREYKEEVNLDIELDQVYKVYSHTYSRNENEVHFWEIEYIVHLSGDESLDNIQLSPEHDIYKLIDINEAKTLEKMYDDKRASLLEVLTAKL